MPLPTRELLMYLALLHGISCAVTHLQHAKGKHITVTGSPCLMDLHVTLFHHNSHFYMVLSFPQNWASFAMMLTVL